jgi:hypothetical protein
MINEDFERESLKDSIYLQEEAHLFYEEMKYSDPRQPAIVLNLTKNDNNPSTLRRINKEELQPGHDLSAPADK